jgi:tetratricopeptide (TPR) repeat protein
MLHSRITRLDLAARRVLEAASVFGDSFSTDGVRAVLGAAWAGENVDRWIASLAEHEIVEHRQDAAASEPTYRFRHALMRDAAYGLLTDDDRQLGHRVAGHYLEGLRDARPTLPSPAREGASHHGDDEILARHFHAGRAWDRALRYTVQAAETAAAAYANQDALRLHARALEICAHVGQPRRTVEVLQKQAMVHLQAGDFAGARSDFEQIVQVAVQISDRGLEGAMLTLRGMTEHFHHDFAASERTLRAALAIGEDGFPGVRFGAAMWLGGIYRMLDRHAEAAPLLSEAERLAPTVEDPFHQAWWGIISGSALIWRGRFTEALAVLERWRVAAGARHQALLSLWTPWLEAMACGGAGKYQRAIACLDDAIASARRVGEPMIVARALNTMGWIHGELGDPERALSWNERGVEAARQLAVPSPEILSNALLNVADDLRDLGRLDEAEQVLRSVEEIIEDARRQDPYLLWRYSLHFLSSSAELALASGDHGRALDLADRCRRAAEDSRSLKYRVKAARLGGRALAATGRLAEADQDLALALDLARQLGNPLELWRTLDARVPVHEALARNDAARAARREASEVVRAVADELTDPSLRDALLRARADAADPPAQDRDRSER